MAKLYDLVIKTGSYKNNQGEEKNRYKNVGACMEGQNGGMFLLLDRTFNPAGVDEGEACLISMFEPKPRDGQQSNQPPQPAHQPQRREAPAYGQQAEGVNQPDSSNSDLPF